AAGLAVLVLALIGLRDADRLHTRAPTRSTSVSLPDTIAALQNVRRAIERRRYAWAESTASLLLPQAEKQWGEESIEAAEVRDGLVRARLYQPSRQPELLAFAEQALARKERILPANDSGLVPSLRNVAASLRGRGKYADARPYLERVVAIDARSLEPN